MTSIALLSPWPPQPSGIADYAFDLADVLLMQGVDLVVYTTQSKPRALDGVKIITVNDTTDFSSLEAFDSLIYQLGNNTDFHLWMLPLLQSHPGIVHVHDLVMHHMAAWLTWMQGDADAYLALLKKWYGERGFVAGKEAISNEQYLWDSDRVAQYPLSEEYLQDAVGILVHSQFALQHIRTSTPHVPSFQVPQLYNIEARDRPSTQLHTIVVLGGVDPQKRLEWVLGALESLKDRFPSQYRLRLQIAGSVDSRCSHLEKQAARLSGGTLDIQVLGRVSEEQFHQLFSEADLCIALRYPTMGETSAIVSKAMQYGLPTIVNDIGWYAELPGHIVKKLPVVDCQDRLVELLEYLIADEQAYREWSLRCHDYASEEFSLQSYGRHYLELCSNPNGEELVSDIFSEVLRECGMTGEDDEDRLLGKIIDQVYF